MPVIPNNSPISLKDNFSTVDGTGEILINNYDNFTGWVRGSGRENNENYLITAEKINNEYEME